MGQNLNDVHSLWRNRIDRKFVFMKLDALGQDKRDSWASYKGALRGGGQRSRIDFEKLTSGIKVYEPQYFGSYASTTSDDNEMGVYQDDRTNILKTAKFKFGVPLALIVVIGSLWYCLDLLFNFGEHTGTEEATKQQQVATSPSSPGQTAPSQAIPPKPKVED